MMSCYQTLFFLNATLLIQTWSRPLTDDVKSRDTVSSRDSLETVFTLSWTLGLGLEGYTALIGLDHGLEYTVLVSYLVDTFIETFWPQRTFYLCNIYQSYDHEIIFLLNCWAGMQHLKPGLGLQSDSSPVFWDSKLDLDLRPVDLDLDLRPMDSDLTISESEDLDSGLGERGLGLVTMGLDYTSHGLPDTTVSRHFGIKPFRYQRFGSEVS